MMNNECERVGLPVPRITDNGFMVKVIFKRPSADEISSSEHKQNTGRTQAEHEKDTVECKKDTVVSQKDTVGSKKDTVQGQKDTVNPEKDTVEHQLNTGRTPVIVQKDTSSTEKEHQLKTKKTPVGKRSRQELRIINIIGEDWFSATDLREALNYKSKSTFIKNYLTPMLENGILKLEKATSLTSPNQRYGLTVKGKAIYYSQK